MCFLLCGPLFLSTLSLRRATGQNLINGIRLVISIHALLAESDDPDVDSLTDDVYFYPRSPCGERQFSRQLIHHQSAFLSTLSLRRAT